MEEFNSNKNYRKRRKRKENLWHFLRPKVSMLIPSGNLVSRCAKMIKDGNLLGLVKKRNSSTNMLLI